MQPTSCPTMMPSKSPSYQPFSSPSCLPTNQPSDQPSAQPSSGPTSYPTPQPSQYTNKTQWISRYYSNVRNSTISLNSNLSQLLFLNLFYDFNPIYGDCAAWNVYLNSASVFKARSVQNIIAISLGTIVTLRADSDMLTCADRDAASAIFNRVVDSTSMEDFNTTCDGNLWIVKNCFGNYSLPSVCINCDEPCEAHCSNAKSVHYLSCEPSDCGNRMRSGVRNYISTLSILTAEKQAAPLIRRMNYQLNGNSVVVSVTISSAGGVYCGIFPSSYLPTSLDEIRLQGVVGYCLSTFEPIATVNFDGLVASSSFEAYCFTFSSNGAHMSLSQMLITGRISFQTACCKLIDLSVSPSVISQRGVYSNLITLFLNALPSSYINVSLHTSSTDIILFPQHLHFSSRSPMMASVYLDARSARVGTKSISATILGMASNEFQMFPSSVNISFFDSFIGASFPRMVSAVFSATGDYVSIRFGSETNLASKSTNYIFTCSELFVFRNSESSDCIWMNLTTLFVYPARLESDNFKYVGLNKYNDMIKFESFSIEVGSVIQLLFGKICNFGQTANCSPTSSIAITAPVPAKPPSLSISGPTFLSHCDSVIVDLTSGSVVNGGGQLANLTLIVASEDASIQSLQKIQNFLNEEYVLSPPTPIPSDYLENGVKYLYKFLIAL